MKENSQKVIRARGSEKSDFKKIKKYINYVVKKYVKYNRARTKNVVEKVILSRIFIIFSSLYLGGGFGVNDPSPLPNVVLPVSGGEYLRFG